MDAERRENDRLYLDEYKEFILQNRIIVNKYLNYVLWFFIATGPAIAIGVKTGAFADISYTTCIIISAVMLLVSLLHFLIMKWKPGDLVTSIIALAALDVLIAYMNYSHVSINLTWFLVPFLSILLCERSLYLGASLFNFVLMACTTWHVSRIDFASQTVYQTPASYFFDRFGGLTIETLIMFISGLIIIKIVVEHFKDQILQKWIVKEKETEMDEKIGLLDSMAEIYDNVNLINFIDSTEMSLRDKERLKHGIDLRQQTHTLMNQRLKNNVLPDQLESFLQFTDIKTVRSRLSHKKIISADFIDINAGWFRAQYITVDATLDGIPNVVIYTTRNVDEEKRREEHLIRVAMTDELTGLYNKRCYEEDLAEYRLHDPGDGFVLFAVDVNGLKKVNDSYGHAAGDELIKGAATCLLSAVGSQGKVYRTGGDEFVALVLSDDPEAICKTVSAKSKEWRGIYSDEMALSVGYASHAENKGMNVDELEKKADAEMYAAKERYYKEKGIERRR